MGVKRLPKTGEFIAIDELGNGVLIIEYTEMIGVDTLGDGPTESAGLKHYLTAANESVNANTDGTYIVVGKDTLLRHIE